MLRNLLGTQTSHRRKAIDFRRPSGGKLCQHSIGHEQVGGDFFQISRFLPPLQKPFEQGRIVGKASQGLRCIFYASGNCSDQYRGVIAKQN